MEITVVEALDTGNILGLDVGERYIGVAVYLTRGSSNVGGAKTSVAQTLSARDESLDGGDLGTGVFLPLKPIIRERQSLCLGPLRRMLARYRVKAMVLGLPQMDHWIPEWHQEAELGSQKPDLRYLRKVKAYYARLVKHFPDLHIALFDEAYSTWVVKTAFKGIKKNNKAESVDSISALYILQSYVSSSREANKIKRG